MEFQNYIRTIWFNKNKEIQLYYKIQDTIPNFKEMFSQNFLYDSANF